MLKKDDILKSIEEVFASMEENIEYELKSNDFVKFNEIRQKNSYSPLSPFYFKKAKTNLILDWKGNGWEQTNIDLSGINNFSLPFALPLAFTFAFSFPFAFIFALFIAENQIQKVKKDDCDGKIVEIEGRKYKLKLI